MVGLIDCENFVGLSLVLLSILSSSSKLMSDRLTGKSNMLGHLEPRLLNRLCLLSLVESKVPFNDCNGVASIVIVTSLGELLAA